MSELYKYKHYLYVLAALLVANYIVMPLAEWQEQEKQSLQLLEKQYSKVDELIAAKANFAQYLQETEEDLARFNTALNVFPSEDEFKLSAQAKIESALTKAKCNIERIGFSGNKSITPGITQWSMDVRYTGKLSCLVKLTRALESSTPLIDIESYNFNHKGFDSDLSGTFNARMKVNVWFKENVE